MRRSEVRLSEPLRRQAIRTGVHPVATAAPRADRPDRNRVEVPLAATVAQSAGIKTTDFLSASRTGLRIGQVFRLFGFARFIYFFGRRFARRDLPGDIGNTH